MGHNSDTVQLDMEYITESHDAVLFLDGDAKVWIPKSQLVDFNGYYRKGESIEITCSEWFANQEGLI